MVDEFPNEITYKGLAEILVTLLLIKCMLVCQVSRCKFIVKRKKILLKLASLPLWHISELKAHFTVKLLKEGRVHISHVYKEHLVGMMFHLAHIGKRWLRWIKKYILYMTMAGMCFKEIFSYRTLLKSKGAGMCQIVLSHIKDSPHDAFPEEAEKEVGRASQRSRDMSLQLLDCKELWAQQAGVAQGHGQWVADSRLSGIWEVMLSSLE